MSTRCIAYVEEALRHSVAHKQRYEDWQQGTGQVGGRILGGIGVVCQVTHQEGNDSTSCTNRDLQ